MITILLVLILEVHERAKAQNRGLSWIWNKRWTRLKQPVNKSKRLRVFVFQPRNDFNLADDHHSQTNGTLLLDNQAHFSLNHSRISRHHVISNHRRPFSVFSPFAWLNWIVIFLNIKFQQISRSLKTSFSFIFVKQLSQLLELNLSFFTRHLLKVQTRVHGAWIASKKKLECLIEQTGKKEEKEGKKSEMTG